jgi:hypothetical protein
VVEFALGFNILAISANRVYRLQVLGSASVKKGVCGFAVMERCRSGLSSRFRKPVCPFQVPRVRIPPSPLIRWHGHFGCVFTDWKPVPRQSAGHLTVETADSVVWLNTYPMPRQSSLASCLMILAVWSSMPDTLAQNLTLNFIGRISANSG